MTAVPRHSIPVGAPAYGLGPEPSGDANVIDVDHRLFLMLAEPIGGTEILTVQGPRSIQFTLPFSDRYLQTPVIQLNQVGYNPRATERYAYLSGWMGDGGRLALDGFPANAEVLADGADPLLSRATAVADLPVTVRRALDSDAATEVREINLARVPAAAAVRYRVRLPGVGVSWPTAISEQAAFKAFFTVTRALFHNRWGGNLATNFTEWSRPADHPTVFTAESTNMYEMYPPDTPQTGPRPLAGGHHDAGDFDQQLTHTKIPELLMRAYEVAPEAFVDGQLILPESGNGIPDLLDEALWNVAAWEQLQGPDGGVRMGVESYTHPPNQGVLAHTDMLPYWTYGVSPHHTARCSGLFAQAARLVAPFNPSRSTQLLRRATNAFHYATNHSAAGAALLWGASELYRLTGEAGYRRTAETIWSSNWTDGSFPFAHLQLDNSDFRENINIPADYWMGYLTASNTSAVIAGQQRHLIDLFAQFKAEEIHTEHAHRNSRPELKGLPVPEVAFGLDLSVTFAVPDKDLKELVGLKSLTHLNLRNTKVTDEGLKELANLPRLAHIDLICAEVTDKGLKNLANVKQLTHLNLSFTGVTDAGLKELVGLKQFNSLDLTGTEVTDAGAKELANLKQLTRLALRGTKVTDATLKELAGLKQLAWLDLAFTKVTAAGVKELKKVLPECKIIDLVTK